MGSSREPTFENALAFAQDLIRIPSPSGGEEDVARRVIEEYEALGFEDVRTDDVGNAIGVIRGSGDAPSVLLNCHLDVVAEGDHSEWEFPPFSGAVENGFLHGRGAMDIKGPLALQTHAAATLKGRARGDIIVAHTVFEERGGLGMQRLLDSGVAPGAVVIGESTHGDVCIGHRGRGEIEIVIHGLAGHASVPGRAANALDLVPAVLTALHELAGTQAEDPMLGRSTLVATGVDVRPESRNVIPDEVTVVVDWRVLPGATHDWMEQSVEEAVRAEVGDLPEGLTLEVRMAAQPQTTYTGVTSERSLFTPGFVMDSDDPVVRASAQAVGQRDGDGPATVRPWAFATDGGWSHGVHGIPTVGFAPGEERYAHTNRERLDLNEARWAFERYPLLIDAVHRALLQGV